MTEQQATKREKKWQEKWSNSNAFSADAKPGSPKYFLTAPYPYTNGLPHLGHLFTYMHEEAFARYKRARGYHVLYPQAWHCTGSPIVNAAKRVAEGDEKQIGILRDFGVAPTELQDFQKPEHWISYFAPKWTDDFKALGMSVDWRRSFITTSLNPHYDAFIRWQFRILKEKGYVALGKHPVVWCPKEHAPVSDHSRLSGEGETPQEFVLVIFKLEHENEYVVTATLRPETISGVTNVWVNPTIEYVKATVDGQTWILSKQCAEKLAEQEHEVQLLSAVRGKEIIGKYVHGPGTARIPLLPATFPTAEKGSGLVMSVPSDAPDDYIALRDLQQNKKLQAEYHLDHLEKIVPIPIIDAQDLGHTAAVTVVEDMKIQNQRERDKLEAAKKIVYKKGFYEGTMLSGPYKGQKVEAAKELIKTDLLAQGHAHKFYELTGPVVCRCLTPCVAKIVSNQWFITYGNTEWKKHAHECLAQMQLYPEHTRSQFTYVLDWLNDWACTREEGLGTRLPWDEHWLIESLSDSTLYNAYYTIAHILQTLPVHSVNDELFNFVFLGRGTPRDAHWKAMRDEFTYWYPVDYRHSGKDLIQNHLSFMIFNHVAILPREYWPRAFGLNGHVTVDGKKMSKSLGNFLTVRNLLQLYGADASRLTILNGGEGVDDANWDTQLAQTTAQRIEQFLAFVSEWRGRGREEHRAVDDWFASKLNSAIRNSTEHFDQTNFRAAIQESWFSLTNTIKQYLRMTANDPHRSLLTEALAAQAILVSPFIPHASEEAWEMLGMPGLVSLASWPACDEAKIRPDLEMSQELIESLTADIRTVQRLLKKDSLESVTVIVSAQWKYDFVEELKRALRQTRDVRQVLQLLDTPALSKHRAAILKIVPTLVKDPARLPSLSITQSIELHAVEESTNFLHKTFGCPISVVVAEESTNSKADAAFPGKPAILLT